ncbi:MAG: O-antigen ligase family protein [Chthoniobacterales bacterium]
MAGNDSLLSRTSEILVGVFLALALAGIQVLIGGTRLVYSLPVYALLGLAGILAVFSRRSKPAPERICLCATAVFFGYIIVRAWFSPVPYLARADIFSVLAGLVIYLSVAFIFISAPWRMGILLFLLLVALVQVGIGAIQFRGGDNFMLIPSLQRFDYGRRASGFYACPNHFAGLVEVIGVFCVSFACWSRWPVWTKLLVGYAGGLCFVGLAFTGSRGGYLSGVGSLLLVAVLTLIALRRAGAAVFWRANLGGGFFALLLAGALFLGFQKSDYLSDRAQNVIDTGNVRIGLWQAAIAQWKLQPVFGTGSGTYLYYGRHFRSERVELDPVEVHNDYLHLLAEYGLLGGAGFLFFFGAHLGRGWEAFQKLGPRRVALSGHPLSNNLALNIGAFGAVGAYLIHSVFDFNLHIPANVFLLAFVFGILANPGRDRENENAKRTAAMNWRRVALPVLGLLLLAVSLRYGPAEYFAERARVALRDERHLSAMRWAQQAVALDDQNPETLFYLGESRVRRAEALSNPLAVISFYDAALDPFQRALALAPNDETFLIALGRVYDALGRFPEGEWMFGRALAWDPRSSVVRKSYAAHLEWWRGAGVARSPRNELPDKNAPLPANSPPAP